MVIRNRPFGKLAVLLGFLVPLIFTSSVNSGDARSVEQFTQATQIWGQAIIDQKIARVQRKLSADIMCEFEYQLAQDTAFAEDQAELVARIESTTPDSVIAQSDTLAIVCPRTN